MAGEKQALKPVSRESRGFHDDRGGLSRDELEERDILVTSGTAYFPGGRNESVTLGSDRRAVMPVIVPRSLRDKLLFAPAFKCRHIRALSSCDSVHHFPQRHHGAQRHTCPSAAHPCPWAAR